MTLDVVSNDKYPAGFSVDKKGEKVKSCQPHAIKRLFYIENLNVPENRCSGCELCRVVCSIFHEGVINPKRSRIKVVYHLLEPNEVILCKQCGSATVSAPCMKACSHDAIYRQADGLILVNEENCTGCGECPVPPCVKACPFGAMDKDPVKNKAVKCDLCRGAALCVKYCPSGVLRLDASPEEVTS